MFQQQQQRKPHSMLPGVISQNETQAKEKLAGYVYEYLVHNGAKQTAEVFKSEVLSSTQSMNQISTGDAPGFLHNWWCVFWDLYAASPERRDKYEYSQEAKAFHELGCIPPSTYPPMGPLMNGMHGVPQFGNGGPGPMGMPLNPDGMMSGYFGRGAPPGPSVQSNQASPIPGGPRYAHPNQRSGAPTPSNIMGGNFPPPAHLNSEQLRNLQAAQRMNPNARIQPNFPIRHMRAGPYGPSGQHPFLDSPSGTPPFPQNQMMPNGMCPSVSMMSSPGGPPPGSVPTNSDGASHDHNRFMMMQTSFGMQHQEGSGTPTSCTAGGPTSVPGMSNNGGGGGHPGSNLGPNSVDNTGNSGQLQNILNGSDTMEMKQSPSSVHGNAANGSTPGGTHHGNPGSIQQGEPASCHGEPSSVHSQSGGSGPHQTPTSDSGGNAMDFQQNVNNPNVDEASEISKIKASLINDYSNY